MGMTSTMPCRTKPRINASFTAKVRGVDARGKAFEVDVVVENLSAGGLYVRLPHQLRVDDGRLSPRRLMLNISADVI